MSKVVTFSRQFPAHHVRQGEQTFFVEKILNTLGIDFNTEDYLLELRELNPELPKATIFDFWTSLNNDITDKKGHTIRGGERITTGETISLRVWSELAYRSKQIKFVADQVVKAWPTLVSDTNVMVNDTDIDAEIIANNDGLTIFDFNSWFERKSPGTFEGQVICWDKKIEY